MPSNADAQPKRDDADVLDAVIGQQPFQVVLRQGVEHAEDAGDDADGHQRPAPPGRRRPEQRQHAQQPVDARLDHHAAHHGRDVRRRGRMGLGQPDVHRNEAGLRAEADHGQQEEDAAAAPPPSRAARNRATRHSCPTAETAPAERPCPGAWPPGRSSRPGERSPCSSSSVTRKNDASDMSSQLIRNSTPLRATTTSNMLAASRLKKNHETPRFLRPACGLQILAAVDGRQHRHQRDRRGKDGRKRVDFHVGRAERHRPRQPQRLRLAGRRAPTATGRKTIPPPPSTAPAVPIRHADLSDSGRRPATARPPANKIANAIKNQTMIGETF